MPSYRVTTEQVVEASTAQEAAAVVAQIPPEQWVVYSDTYREVTTVSPQQVADVHATWEEEIVDAEILDAEILDAEIITSPGDVVIRDQEGKVVASYPAGRSLTNDIFEVDIDPGEYWGDPST